MTCRNRPHVLKVLTGQLSPGKSNEMLEHFRRCGECREAFDFAAKTMTRSAAASEAAARAPDAGPTGAEDLPRSPVAWPSPARRNRRTLVVLGIAIVGLMLAGVGRDRARPPAELAREVLWKRALAEGTPIVQSPAGGFDARPRVITALLPPGSGGSLRLTILDDSGRTVFQTEVKPGAGGCFVEEVAIDAPEGAFRAARLMAPFPEAGALALDPGRAYGAVVSIGGAHASCSSVFQLAPESAGLQGPTGEGR
jgi:hypothetical protein